MQRGGYAFKVIPYLDVFYEWQGIFYWLDAGDLIREGISRELTMVRHYGLYSPPSAGNVGIWVHNKTQQFLVDNGLFSHFVPNKRAMISSGVLIMDYNNATIRDCFVPIKTLLVERPCRAYMRILRPYAVDYPVNLA